LLATNASAHKTPVEIKYDTWSIHALRHYPFKQNADSIVQQFISRNDSRPKTKNTYKKTAMDLVVNKQFMNDHVQYSTPVYKFIIKPYISWLDYAHPINEQQAEHDLTVFLSEDYKIMNQKTKSSPQNLFESIGADNINYFLDEWIGEIDLFKNKNEVLFQSVKSPLSKDGSEIYSYFISGKKEINGVIAYEIAFFSKQLKDNAFEGYLYFSENDLSFVKAIFTLNFHMKNMDKAKNVLFTQTASEKENILYLGNDMQVGLLVNQTILSSDKRLDSLPRLSLTSSEKEISGLIAQANHTPAYQNLEKGLTLLLFDRIGFARHKLELGPISQMLHYNKEEGLRLRVGANTTPSLHKHLLLGGYLAYGLDDKQWKYRGNISYRHHRGNQWNFTYVKDLNIPGYDLLEDKRDRIFSSFYHSGTRNMSLQKMGQLSYENLFFKQFSLKISAKYWFDQPIGSITYQLVNQGTSMVVDNITNTEIGISLRYAPKERYIRLSDRRIVFRKADFDLKLNHRIGMKGILGSDYNYRISDFSIFKQFDLPVNVGRFDVRISGGKIWDRIPYPMLFIPAGNQGYVFDSNDYNLMNFYEFVTDRFVGGNANIQFNWSPVKLIFKKNKIKTNLGIKTIYGPLSDNNNPLLHPELFIFDNQTQSLGNQPYTEASIGLDNIFRFLRIDYVYRLSHRNRSSLFFSTSFNF
jgi:hypothetical protein